MVKFKSKCPNCNTININTKQHDEGRPHALNLYVCRACNKAYHRFVYFRNHDTQLPDERVEVIKVESLKTGKKYLAIQISEKKYLVKIDKDILKIISSDKLKVL